MAKTEKHLRRRRRGIRDDIRQLGKAVLAVGFVNFFISTTTSPTSAALLTVVGLVFWLVATFLFRA